MSYALGTGALIGRKITVYTDGAARGNPGPSASGFMAYEDGKLIHKHAEYNGNATNNYAEYRAVLIALSWCASHIGLDSSLELYSDNELVVRQLNGKYKTKSRNLKPINERIKVIVSKFKRAEFRNVRRENLYISAVDRSLNALLDARIKSDSA